MALTTLDAVTALILIDLQQGIVAMATAHQADSIVKRGAALADAFRRHKLPVVLVNVAGTAPGRADQPPALREFPPGFAEIVPDIGPRPGDVCVTKHSWGGFTETNLDVKLQKLGVTQVVIAGIATSIGVETTARQAYELGYNVTLVSDAMTDLRADAHANSVTRIFPRLGETGSTQDVIDLLASTRRAKTA